MQFSETDAAGIVHFSWFFRYLEDAEHALWREAGLSIHPEESAIGWPRVGGVVRVPPALKFEQEFDVTVRVGEMTKRTIGYTVRDHAATASGSRPGPGRSPASTSCRTAR